MVYALADRAEESKLDIPDWRKFITAQTMDNECRLTAAAASQPKPSFWYDAVGVLESESLVDGASQRYVPSVLRPRVMRLYCYSVMSGQLGE